MLGQVGRQTEHLAFSERADYPFDLIHTVCCLAGSPSFLEDLCVTLRHHGVMRAVAAHNTAALFEWLVGLLSYQGIADSVAAGYMERHGRVSWNDIAAGLVQAPECPKLSSYWQFNGCQYQKAAASCAQPGHFQTCPLPTHRLRNGHLNQLAYSLFLFIRDIADGDLVGWVDQRLAQADEPDQPQRHERLREAVIGPLRHVYGVSDKVLNMACADLLLGAGKDRPLWLQAGGSMVAIDTLVHNFLHRTGILKRLNASHPYGPACYRPGGCADIIGRATQHIDARTFNRRFPQVFPRFVQHAIWRYCAQDVFDVCNGNTIDDRDRCANDYCRIYSICDRIVLQKKQVKA